MTRWRPSLRASSETGRRCQRCLSDPASPPPCVNRWCVSKEVVVHWAERISHSPSVSALFSAGSSLFPSPCFSQGATSSVCCPPLAGQSAEKRGVLWVSAADETRWHESGGATHQFADPGVYFMALAPFRSFRPPSKAGAFRVIPSRHTQPLEPILLWESEYGQDKGVPLGWRGVRQASQLPELVSSCLSDASSPLPIGLGHCPPDRSDGTYNGTVLHVLLVLRFIDRDREFYLSAFKET